MRRTCAIAVVVFGALVDGAAAQVSAGGTWFLSLQPGRTPEAGNFSPEPHGVARGVTIFAGAAINRAIGVQGELSVPSRISTVEHLHYLSFSGTETTWHRDVLVSGLFRLRRPGQPCCDLIAGAGLVFARTTGIQITLDRDPGSVVTTSTKSRPNTPQMALTVGGDFPIPVHRRFALLPTLRIHWMRRPAEPEPPSGFFYWPVGRPATTAWHLGVGARVDF